MSSSEISTIFRWSLTFMLLVSYFLIGQTESFELRGIRRARVGGCLYKWDQGAEPLLGKPFGLIWHFITVVLHHCSRGSNTSTELELSLDRSGRTVLKVAKINHLSERLPYFFILGVKQFVFIKIYHVDTYFTIETGFPSPDQEFKCHYCVSAFINLILIETRYSVYLH